MHMLKRLSRIFGRVNIMFRRPYSLHPRCISYSGITITVDMILRVEWDFMWHLKIPPNSELTVSSLKHGDAPVNLDISRLQSDFFWTLFYSISSWMHNWKEYFTHFNALQKMISFDWLKSDQTPSIVRPVEILIQDVQSVNLEPFQRSIWSPEGLFVGSEFLNQ